MSTMKINILHLYPDLLNLYGDSGNIAALKKRLNWRGIDAEVSVCTKEEEPNFALADILVLGGGSEKEETIVANLLNEKKQALTQYIEDDGVCLATCGGYPLLGRFKNAEKGLGILDIVTEEKEPRLAGNVVLQSEFTNHPIVGFANHSGRTEIGGYTPLGVAVAGSGNTGALTGEGLVYKNLVATYLHGPLLPKNPELCDLILTRAMEKKYPDFQGLTPLEDALENMANDYVATTYKEK